MENETEILTNNYLTAGMTFTPIAVKSFTTKKYSRIGVKILDESGDEYYTTAAKIVKILTDLSDESKYGTKFTVVQKGTYNGFPVLSLTTDNAQINKEIMLLMF